MAITWSRLHEVLGVQTARPLAVEDIEHAISLNLEEDEALDFKAQLRTEEPKRVELAKDVAAMANSGGGLIVFGVGEEGDDKHLVNAPIEIPAEPEQTIHQLLAARVRPLVRPLVEAIRRDDGTTGYLLVQVPDSPAAPHFYEHNPDPKNPPGAPIRHGSGTLMMREHDIERAYRDRFARQSDTLARVEQLIRDTRERLGFTEGDARHWAIVATTPLSSPPIGAPRSDAGAARETRDAAYHREGSLYRDDSPSGLLRELSLNPRRGLRRWVMRHETSDPDSTSTTRTYGELHDDGSSILAFPVAAMHREYGREKARSAIHATYVQVACAAAVVLADRWLAARRITSGASMLASIVTSSTDHELVWALAVGAGGFTNAQIQPWSRPLKSVVPVDAFLHAPRDLNNKRAAAAELAEGVLHQFGVEHLDQLARPEG